MKRIINIGLIALAIIALFVLLGRRSATKEVHIGVLVPLSSDFAWWGDEIHHAIDVSQVQGLMKSAVFTYADTKCNGKDVVSGFQFLRLRYPDTHLFIVGCDNDLKAIKSYLSTSTDLAFMVGLSERTLYETGVPTINLAYRLEAEGSAAADFAFDKLGSRRLGVIVSATDFGRTLGDNAIARFVSRGGTTSSEYLKYNETNPESAILKVLAFKPDTIYIHNDIPGMSAILKRLAQLGYKGNKIVYYGGHDQSLIDTAGYAAEGAYTPWVIASASTSKQSDFEDLFRAAYKKAPFVTAYFVRDGIELLNESLNSCGLDTVCISDHFYSRLDFTGTLGTVRYKPNGEVDRVFNFQQIRGGKFIDINI